MTGDDSLFVMAGLDPAIHALLATGLEDVDTRDKRGHDASCVAALPSYPPCGVETSEARS
jgi:hypothetical protein